MCGPHRRWGQQSSVLAALASPSAQGVGHRQHSHLHRHRAQLGLTDRRPSLRGPHPGGHSQDGLADGPLPFLAHGSIQKVKITQSQTLILKILIIDTILVIIEKLENREKSLEHPTTWR